MKKISTDSIAQEKVSFPEGHSYLFRYDHIFTEDELGYHCHPEIELQFVSKGGGVHVIGDISEPSVEGEVFVIPANVPHAWFWDESLVDQDGRIEEFTIQFHPELMHERMSLFPEMKECNEYFANLKDAIEIKGETAARLRCLFRGCSIQDRANQLLTLFHILVEISQCKEMRVISTRNQTWKVDQNSERIDKVYKYMLENYSRTVTLDEIAGIACMNKASFCAFFKKVTGKTYSAWMNDYRINRACLLLSSNPSKSINEVCYMVGFNDISHFNRVFKQLKGCSPRFYRRK
jgi:AraC-type DNA-binding domain-containing proteins